MLFNKVVEDDMLPHTADTITTTPTTRPGNKAGETRIVTLTSHIGRLVHIQSHLNNVEEDIHRHQRSRTDYRRSYRQMRMLWEGLHRKESHWPHALHEPGIVEDAEMRALLARVWTHDEPLALPRLADVYVANAMQSHGVTEGGPGGEVVAAAYRQVGDDGGGGRVWV